MHTGIQKKYSVKKKEDIKMNQTKTAGRFQTRQMTAIAMLSAASYVMYLFGFHIPLVPNFLTMDFSELPAVIASLSMGPVAGILVCAIKNIFHLLVSHTMWVGELSNFILGVAFCVPAGLIYGRRKTRQNAVAALICGALIMAIVSIPSNYFLIYPLYDKIAFPMTSIIAAYSAINPNVTSLLPALVMFNVPFTLVKAMVSVVMTLLIYKPISQIIKQGIE